MATKLRVVWTLAVEELVDKGIICTLPIGVSAVLGLREFLPERLLQGGFHVTAQYLGELRTLFFFTPLFLFVSFQELRVGIFQKELNTLGSITHHYHRTNIAGVLVTVLANVHFVVGRPSFLLGLEGFAIQIGHDSWMVEVDGVCLRW